MDSRKTWKRTVDSESISDDEIPLFPEGWVLKVMLVDSDDEVPGATISRGLGAEGKARF